VHGLIFTTFKRYTQTQLADSHDAIWEGQPTFLAVDAYADEAFEALVARAATLTGATRRELLHDFGAYTGKTAFYLMRPDYYEASPGVRDFLLDVEERIHETVRSTIPGAAPPRLQVVPFGETGVSIAYTSPRRLCDLLEGLVVGTAAYYGERVEIEEATCVERGDLACMFLVTPSRGA
jgi:predicted hydrocarbon binding protein